jgi:hypothetical protein
LPPIQDPVRTRFVAAGVTSPPRQNPQQPSNPRCFNRGTPTI